ncbi:MAG: WYL domain-containing protein [Bacillota bacterium]|nr:WYL domain-containing protein [Bacillota bacterium]
MVNNYTKKRLLLILELLYKTTDEENPISTVGIMKYLEKKGLSIDRKTLASDIKTLTEMDYDIVTIKSSPNKYFWGNRTFEIPELKMLIDAVSSARFITKKKSKELIEKIATLAGDAQYENMNRHIVATGRAKSDNKKLYYIVDTISEAINKKKKIQFKYTEYNADKEKVFRHDGEVYTVSPYVLYWNEDYYYVVGYYDKREMVAAFRVDRLHTPKVIDEQAVPKPKDFNIDDYANKIFKMFDGEEAIVELECENHLMKYIIDHYGGNIETNRNSQNTFIAKVPATLTPTFYAWVFQFSGGIRIISPPKAIECFNKMLEANKGDFNE